MKELLFDTVYLSLIAGAGAFFLSTSFYLYPIIINISRIKGLMDTPGERKMHVTQTPTLGGLGIFITFTLSIIVFGLLTDLMLADLTKLLALLGSAIILVFLGIKDDLVSMSPKKKFLGQLLAVGNVVLLTDIRISSFEGILGIGDLPYVASVLFTAFVFILVINAVNLIDGIDGLAGTIAIVASLAFGIMFLLNDDYLMMLVSSILVGSVIGFLRYNLSTDKKIFMGDCGSMLTGFLLAYQGVCFLNLNADGATANTIMDGPVLLLAILSYPLFDLLRVFTIRMKQGRSPFSADSNHIHHRLLRIGLPHNRATLLLGSANSLVIGFAFLINGLDIHLYLGFTVLFGVLLYLVPFMKIFDVNFESKHKTRELLEKVSKESADALDIQTAMDAPNRNLNEANILHPNGKISDNNVDKETNRRIVINNRIQTLNHLSKKIKKSETPKISKNMLE
jgi:UDP-N-acetylmuramyl pentapeptide phosphotransferase/UDP-N-acetylglucosamine-1-phosphate transferase